MGRNEIMLQYGIFINIMKKKPPQFLELISQILLFDISEISLGDIFFPLTSMQENSSSICWDLKSIRTLQKLQPVCHLCRPTFQSTLSLCTKPQILNIRVMVY